ncbi:hypothetical protein A7Q26_22000 [Sphingobium sp. TCM1]|nr:hypothetical protein A7Q26_22000 [Sphingobium sp. TCM1]
MPAVAIKNVADEVPVNACIVHSDQYPAILEAAVIIGCVFFFDAMLGEHFVQAAPDSSKNSAKADRFRNSRSRDGAGGGQRTHTRNCECRDPQTSPERTASQDAAKDVSMMLIGDLAIP